MAKHALLIGIDKYAHFENNRLRGCVNDAEVMAKLLLKRFRFETAELLLETKATRAGLQAGVRGLADKIMTPQDVAVIFYAGHGSRSKTQQAEMIVPVDSGRDAATATDIFDWEIAGWIRDLNQRTPNVTLIFDACHSGGATRDSDDLRSREVPGVSAEMFPGGHVPRPPAGVRAAQRSGSRGPSRWLPPVQRDAVVLAACHASQTAKETKKHGVFTSFLLAALKDLERDARVTWGEVHQQIVRAMAGHPQNPQLEGDADRIVFGAERLDRGSSAPVVAVRSRQREVDLAAGVLDGVTPGSTWTVLPASARGLGTAPPIAAAEISRAGLTTSQARIVDRQDNLEVGQLAFPAVSPSPSPVAATGRREHIYRQLRDLQNPAADDPLREMVRGDLIQLRVLRRRDSGDEIAAVTMESAGDGVFKLTEPLLEGDLVDVEIENRSRSRAIFANLLQLGVDHDVGLLWPRTDHVEYQPSFGLAAAASRRWIRDYLSGDDDFGELRDGVPLKLPEVSSDTALEPLILKLVVTSQRFDLGFLEGVGESPGGLDVDWATLTVEVPVRRGDVRREDAVSAPDAATSQPATFADFEVKIGKREGEGHPLFVNGTRQGTVNPLQNPLVLKRVRAFESAPLVAAQRPGTGLLRRKSTAMKRAQTVGRDLFEAVMSSVRESYETAKGAADGLRLRLDVEAPDLGMLPWELLHDNAAGYLCLSVATPVVRYLERSADGEIGAAVPKFRILGMIARPKGFEQLDVEREVELMEAAVHHLVEAGDVELDWVQGETEEALAGALASGDWHAFHFIGHGGVVDADGESVAPSPEAGQAFIALADADREPHRVTASRLADLLGGREALRLVVLNSCKGARASANNLFSSFGPKLEERGIPAVVAMQYEITDEAAIHFSAILYESIARALPVDSAVTEARRTIREDLNPTVEWSTPVLQMRSHDGRLLELDSTGAIFSPDIRQRLRRSRGLPGSGTASGKDTAPGGALRQRAETLKQGLAGFADERLSWTAGRPILLRKVSRFWLQDAPSDAGSETALAMQWKGRRTLARPGAKPEVLPPEHRLGEVLDGIAKPDSTGLMLILGPPGAGKSVALLEVLGDLCDAAAEGPESAARPVPLRFELAEWDASQPLLDWLAAQMSVAYKVPEGSGRLWLEEGRLAILLDGLDEVAASERIACAEAINTFVHRAPPPFLVVSCGLKEYLEMPVRLAAGAAIRLAICGRRQLLASLWRTGGKLEGLADLLQRNPALQIQARSPVWLRFLSAVYPRLPAATARRLESLHDPREIRSLLLDAYVESRFDPAAGAAR